MSFVPESPTMFDEQTSEVFTRFANMAVAQAHGQDGFVPGPYRGKDGGIDSRHVRGASGSEPKTQYKFHQISGWAGRMSKLHQVAHDDFVNFLKDKFDGTPGPYIYVTNVQRTQTYIDKDIEVIRSYEAQGATVEYWDQPRLVLALDANPALYEQFIPHYSSQTLGIKIDELKKQRKALERAREKARRNRQQEYQKSEEFIGLSKRFSAQYIDTDKLKNTYVGILYLVQPLLVNDSDGAREIIRALFNIDPPTEKSILDTMLEEAKIDITGNYITCNDKNLGETAATAVVEFMAEDLDKVLELLEGKA